MQWIWHCAAKALEAAEKVEFVGYSLPESDLAVRVLLSPLRFRLERRDVSIVVQDKNGEVLDRWCISRKRNQDDQASPLGSIANLPMRAFILGSHRDFAAQIFDRRTRDHDAISAHLALDLAAARR
jgi:hypothetical protein